MKTERQFDAVKTMREIRDEISREIQGMSFEQERKYIDKHLKARKRRVTSASTARPASP